MHRRTYRAKVATLHENPSGILPTVCEPANLTETGHLSRTWRIRQVHRQINEKPPKSMRTYSSLHFMGTPTLAMNAIGSVAVLLVSSPRWTS